ncbi:MAG: diversity-generating retroelement protein Avd [Planctomycetes bacterium]|nr:diversity-generating retroelement protein Avd [Planctomycetota bacterium]
MRVEPKEASKKLTEPAVFQQAYDLTQWYAHHTGSFPQTHRFTLGDRIENGLMDLLGSLQDAVYGRRRPESLAHAQHGVDRLRLWNRLARDLKCIGPKQYAYAAERIEEVGRQVGGWRRSPQGRMGAASATDGTTRPVPARRWLEQQRQQYPLCEPQQERTDEP